MYKSTNKEKLMNVGENHLQIKVFKLKRRFFKSNASNVKEIIFSRSPAQGSSVDSRIKKFKNKIIQSLSENLRDNPGVSFALFDFTLGIRGRDVKIKTGSILRTTLEKGSLEKCETLDEFKSGLRRIKGIAHGLKEMHDRNIVHRDLAARNVLEGQNQLGFETVAITDLGRSRELDGTGKYISTGTKGPIRWMAPEELATGESSKASDVWSLGVTIYEIATGNLPYHSKYKDDYFKIANDVTEGKLFPEVGSDDKNIAQYILNALLKQCCQYDPKNRITPEQLIFYLDELMQMNSFGEMVSYIHTELGEEKFTG